MTTTERAILAGGCFWGMQDLVRKMDGVISTRVGYSGGSTPNATYATVKTGTTGHAEALEVVFDPSKMSFSTGEGSNSAKAWKDIWGCGQGIGAISAVTSTAALVARLRAEYAAARARLAL